MGVFGAGRDSQLRVCWVMFLSVRRSTHFRDLAAAGIGGLLSDMLQARRLVGGRVSWPLTF
jgi:hypothetical protein